MLHVNTQSMVANEISDQSELGDIASNLPAPGPQRAALPARCRLKCGPSGFMKIRAPSHQTWTDPVHNACLVLFDLKTIEYQHEDSPAGKSGSCHC